MKTLVVALMLIATMVLPATSVAVPKHAASANKHAHSTDASKAQADAAQPDAAAAEVADTSWKGKIGGLVVALGGAALAAQLGLDPAWLGLTGAALLAILLVVVVVILVRLLSRILSRIRRGPAVYAGDYLNSIMPDNELRVEPSIRPVAPRAAQHVARQIARQAAKARKGAADTPEGFDVAKFLRSANTYFLRLQVAWDRGDLGDIREFVDPEIAEELKSQLKHRGDKPNRTGVDALDAELLKLESSDAIYVASVKFSGLIREENDAAKRFVEVWSLSKPVSSAGGWTLAGIQQFE